MASKQEFPPLSSQISPLNHQQKTKKSKSATEGIMRDLNSLSLGFVALVVPGVKDATFAAWIVRDSLTGAPGTEASLASLRMRPEK